MNPVSPPVAKKGIYAAAITPLNGDGVPDMDKLIDYSHWLIHAGPHGVVIFGTTGEGNSLPLEFRLAAPRAFAKAGFRSDEVIFGTGFCAVSDAIGMTRAALECGFNSVLVLPPFYYKNPTEDGLFDYYAALIDGVNNPDLRIILYHIPAMSAVPITVGLVRRLRDEFGPIIAGLKDSTGNLAGTLEFVQIADDFLVYPSNDGDLIEALAGGCAGVISAAANAMPGLIRSIYDASGAERLEQVDRLRSARDLIWRHPLMSAFKEIQARRSGDETWRRLLPPLRPLEPGAANDLVSGLEALNIEIDRLPKPPGGAQR